MTFDVTVVTVVYEAVKGGRKDVFRRCMESVVAQKDVGVEYILVDGGSTDGTKEMIVAFAEVRENVLWLSEPDRGIYDAMNKGLKMAKGRYITFLNSDDYYHDENGLKESVDSLDSSKADFSYAPAVILKPDGSRSTTSPHVKPDLRNLLKGMPFSHQSVLVRTDLMKRKDGFSLAYPRSADYAFIMDFVFSGCRAVRVNRDFVTFRTGGFSSQNPAENQREHAIAFWNLSRRYLGCELTDVELNAYVYACVLRTFGAVALKNGWFGAASTIAPVMADRFREISALRREVVSLKHSTSYRVGLFATWPLRKLYRFLESKKSKRNLR